MGRFLFLALFCFFYPFLLHEFGNFSSHSIFLFWHGDWSHHVKDSHKTINGERMYPNIPSSSYSPSSSFYDSCLIIIIIFVYIGKGIGRDLRNRRNEYNIDPEDVQLREIGMYHTGPTSSSH